MQSTSLQTAKLSSEPAVCRFNRVSLLLAAAYLVILAQVSWHYLRSFPDSYAWTEMMINYQGGFVRRGLLGEAAFQLNGLVKAPYFLTGIEFLAYAYVGIWAIRIALRASTSIALLFLLSPAGILFPFWDFEAFGRKDIFILTAFALSTRLLQIRRPGLAIGGIFALYAVFGFIAEAAFFFLPLVIAAFAILRGKRKPATWHIGLWASSGAFLAANFALLALMNHAGDGSSALRQAAIMQSWRALYPDAYPAPGAVTWIGYSLKQGYQIVVYHQRSMVTSGGYLVAFLLANVPTLLLLRTCRRTNNDRMATLAVLAGLVPLLATFATGADWGRYTYLFVIQTFAFAIQVTERASQAVVSGRPSPWTAAVRGCLIFLFATTWQVKHWRPYGVDPLVPGGVFRIGMVQSPTWAHAAAKAPAERVQTRN